MSGTCKEAPMQQELNFFGSSQCTRQKMLREHILAGDDVFASIIEGPSLREVQRKAAGGYLSSFLIAGAMAVILEPEIRELLQQGKSLNRKTCPQLFEDAFEIYVRFGSVSEPLLGKIDEGLLPRGTGGFSASNMKNSSSFDFWFPVVFCSAYDPDAPGIKGSLHIPQHTPWKK